MQPHSPNQPEKAEVRRQETTNDDLWAKPPPQQQQQQQQSASDLRQNSSFKNVDDFVVLPRPVAIRPANRDCKSKGIFFNAYQPLLEITCFVRIRKNARQFEVNLRTMNALNACKLAVIGEKNTRRTIKMPHR